MPRVPQQARPTNLSRAEAMGRRLEAVSGLRMTGQRERVLQAVSSKVGVVNPEALYDELRPAGIGRATVYRTLDLLERHGMLSRIHLDGCHGFTICDEGHHHHLICRSCNTVLPVDARPIEEAIRQLASSLNFGVETHTLEFTGICESCQSRRSRSA
ncbi:MAG: transcriptional repressor [Chloroflexota bacterium]|nr:transcriptional repressor [Chloroflexota bacterium]